MQFSHKIRPLVAVVAAGFLFAACGGDNNSAETTGVASVSDLDDTTTDAAEVAAAQNTTTDGDTADPEEIVLQLAQCMRDNSFADFPDPVADGNGGFGLRDAIQSSGIDFQDPAFRETIDLCRMESGADQLGTGARGANREALEEGLLIYTDCLRSEGLDVGDLTFGGNAGAGQAQGQGQEQAQGQGQGRAQGEGGATGDRSSRIANRLGLDLEDPATVAALAACEPTLEEALAGFGQGGNRQPAAATTDS